jgi:myo-inositol 2-dehydrogenase/D-chiro-inositol 1-dehydrogenase
MGADHARTLATQVPGATVQFICDADAGKAKSVAAETGAVETSTDPFSAIRSAGVDAVLVASPDATHGELSIAAIMAGKPVLCEKPLAPTSAECLRVVDAEVRGGKRLVQVGFMRRFDPLYRDMKAGLESGAIGRPLMFHCFHRNVSAPSWFDQQMAITNSASHEFDIARWMLDADYKSINVFRPASSDANKPGAPVFMVVETTAGQLVNIEINNNAAYGYDVRGELVGEKGTISLRSPSRSETSVNLMRGISYPEDWRPRFADAYRLQLQAWIRSIGTDDPVGASAWDGYCAALVAEAGVASLAGGAAVAVVHAARPELY